MEFYKKIRVWLWYGVFISVLGGIKTSCFQEKVVLSALGYEVLILFEFYCLATSYAIPIYIPTHIPKLLSRSALFRP